MRQNEIILGDCREGNMTAHDDYSDNWEYESGHINGFGGAHAVSGDGPIDPLAALHAVVEEVTGKPVPATPPRRVGFL